MGHTKQKIFLKRGQTKPWLCFGKDNVSNNRAFLPTIFFIQFKVSSLEIRRWKYRLRCQKHILEFWQFCKSLSIFWTRLCVSCNKSKAMWGNLQTSWELYSLHVDNRWKFLSNVSSKKLDCLTAFSKHIFNLLMYEQTCGQRRPLSTQKIVSNVDRWLLFGSYSCHKS
jgi:hypothetical protein